TSEVVHFDHRESFEVNVRVALFQAADQFEEVFERQIGMKAADDVKFRGALTDAFIGALIDFFKGVGIRAWRIWITAEGAKFAVGYADIRRINVAIDIVIGDVAVLFFANVIGEPAGGEKIWRAIELHAVVEGETFSRENFVRDGLQSLVV